MDNKKIDKIMNKWKLCVYFTPNYEKVYWQYLEPSLKKLQLNHYMRALTHNLGGWKENTDYKPSFLLDCLEKFDCDIVITDVDSVIHEYPILFDNIPQEYDIAVHNFSWETHYGRPNDKDKFEILSGTMYLRNNEKVRRLVRKWKSLCFQHSWEQKALEQALKQIDINVFNLPREYCYITSCPKYINNGKVAIPLDKPIIEHFQASRDFKNGRG